MSKLDGTATRKWTGGTGPPVPSLSRGHASRSSVVGSTCGRVVAEILVSPCLDMDREGLVVSQSPSETLQGRLGGDFSIQPSRDFIPFHPPPTTTTTMTRHREASPMAPVLSTAIP